VQFGGLEQARQFWFTAPADAGSCFPGGHAAGGFALVAIYFAGMVAGNRRLERAGLVLVLLAGTSFSLVRIAQGAHFLSHNLWSAAICWALAALVFRQSFVAGGAGARRPGVAARAADDGAGVAVEPRLVADPVATGDLRGGRLPLTG
jgi:membrane-associated PAP2 superfamily phosphatase